MDYFIFQNDCQVLYIVYLNKLNHVFFEFPDCSSNGSSNNEKIINIKNKSFLEKPIFSDIL